jgi:hypothetical protein
MIDAEQIKSHLKRNDGWRKAAGPYRNEAVGRCLIEAADVVDALLDAYAHAERLREALATQKDILVRACEADAEKIAKLERALAAAVADRNKLAGMAELSDIVEHGKQVADYIREAQEVKP